MLLSAALYLTAIACEHLDDAASAQGPNSEPGTAGATTQPVTDKPLASYQNELLELAFLTATAIPVDPHIKDRSLSQEEVVTACLKLDQPQRAVGYITQIANWRRGTANADLAFYCARHGDADSAQRYLKLAGEAAQTADDWRKDRIRVKMAMSHVWLGQSDRAAQMSDGVGESESGKVEAVNAMLADSSSFDKQILAMDVLLATRQFDAVKNTLEAYAQLYNRMYDDKDRRALVEQKMRINWEQMPILIQIALILDLADIALDHKDQAKALGLVREAQVAMDYFQWVPEDQIPVMARLAGVRFRAGDTERARKDADAALALFDSQEESLLKIDRAGMLRSIAQAHRTMGDTPAALAAYRRAVEKGAIVASSRPRAMDLSATCCSMALNGIEPDAELWARMRQIHEELGPLW